ncbi:Crp/Fnr family transcriptional regulator [Vallitalea pronyensis]|uniref:Crp/Fnr family transcriptional regulator n=1 Tax=Vallitalea pronyensis TaxID=1348613 RepID=A0A8J8MP96_9FIRM|nr:Crp/Fnr family transcriptional regulator [Vallitalea pronyensis]QUI25119.1 Crp/Fnr family transcriptional regulator [Vallitalea pronyensis]
MNTKNKSLIEELRKKVFRNPQSSDTELMELSQFFMAKEYRRNEFLVREGERWNKVFFIHKGILRLFYMDKKGREFNKGFFQEGQFVWPIAPSAQKEDSLFSIAAVEDMELSVCLFDPFCSWLKQHHYWDKFALSEVEAFVEQKFVREHEFLMYSATERYHSFCAQYPGLVKRVPDYHLASYIGISNVSLSRIKNASF